MQQIYKITMKKKNNNQEKPKTGYIYLGCMAGGYFLFKADENLKNYNLGQVNSKTNIPKYLGKNAITGRNTGSGQAFEDLAYTFYKSNGDNIVKMPEVENGADFKINGVEYQLKCNRTDKGVFNDLFKDGKYRYPGQKLLVNSEVEDGLKKMIKANKSMFGEEIVEVNPPGSPRISRAQVHEQQYRGWKSMRNDAVEILKDPGEQGKFAVGMIVSFCAIIGIGAILEYVNRQKKESTLKDAGKAVTASIKKHWGKAIITTVGIAAVALGVRLFNRQLLRPISN